MNLSSKMHIWTKLIHKRWLKFIHPKNDTLIILPFFNTVANIINWITLTRKSNKYCTWHTELLVSCFDLIRFHQPFYTMIPPPNWRGYDYMNAYLQFSWEDVALEVTVSSVRVQMSLTKHIRLIGSTITMTSLFGITCVQCGPVAQW